MQEEAGQELYTRDHGTVKVDKKSWMDGGLHIVLCPNGAYQHTSGLPIKDEKELRKAFGSNTEDLDKALNWFRNRHEQQANPPRPISFRSDNTPVFDDGSIPEESDLYNFFSPGPVLSAAIVGLHEFRKRKESGQAPPELRKVATPTDEPLAPPVQAAPALPAENRLEAHKVKERARQAKMRAAKKAKTKAPAQATG